MWMLLSLVETANLFGLTVDHAISDIYFFDSTSANTSYFCKKVEQNYWNFFLFEGKFTRKCALYRFLLIIRKDFQHSIGKSYGNVFITGTNRWNWRWEFNWLVLIRFGRVLIEHHHFLTVWRIQNAFITGVDAIWQTVQIFAVEIPNQIGRSCILTDIKNANLHEQNGKKDSIDGRCQWHRVRCGKLTRPSFVLKLSKFSLVGCHARANTFPWIFDVSACISTLSRFNVDKSKMLTRLLLPAIAIL